MTRDPIHPDRIYNVQESAALLGVDDSTLYKAIEAKELPAKVIGKGYKIVGDNLLRFAGATPDHIFFKEPEVPVFKEAGPEAFK